MNNLCIMALWDTNSHRANTLKDNLDMFAPESRETTLLPRVIELPLEAYDVVLVSFDKCSEPALSAARVVRQSSETTFLLLVSEKSNDNSPFFRPAIRPSGVLFHPVKNAQLREILGEIEDEMQRLAESETDTLFVFKSENALRRIPLNGILFFEARNKKILIRIKYTMVT